MVRLWIFCFIFLNFITANAGENVPLELYKNQKKNQINPLVYSVKKNSNEFIVTLKNENKEPIGPVFPIFPQFVKRDDYTLLADNCSYKVIKSQDTCQLVLKSKDNFLIRIYIYPYGKKEHKTEIILGKKVKTETVLSLVDLKEIELNPQPMVERIGVESFYDFPLDIKEDKIEVVNEHENLYFTIIEKDNVKFLRVFPQEEDYFDVKVKIKGNNNVYIQKLSFTALVRKPISIKIKPLVKTVPIDSELNFSMTATFANGHPLNWDIPSFLINWDGNDIKVLENKNVFFAKQTEVSLTGSALGLKDQIKFNVIEQWPYKSSKNLIVESGQTMVLSDEIIYSFNTIEVKPNAILKIKVNNSWAFLGAENKFVNNGLIQFEQPYSGDMSSNLPGLDGNLNGIRVNLNTNSNNVFNGGFLYIKTGFLLGKGVFNLSGSKQGNLGGIYIDYLKENKFSGKIIGTVLHNEQFIKQVVFQPVHAAPSLEKIRPEIYNFNSSVKDSIGSLFRYLIVGLVPYFLLYFVFLAKIKKYKIQKTMPSTKQNLKDLGYSFFSAIIINFIVAFGITGMTKSIGWNKIYVDSVSAHGLLWFWFSFFFILIFHDIYFYFTHRLLHTPWLYNKIHYIHHQAKNPTPLTAYAFHPLEAFLHFLYVPIITCIVPIHGYVLVWFLWIMLIFNAHGHSGFEYWPKKMRNGLWRIIMNNSFHHNQHHSHFNCNYSLYFNFLDRWFKTNHKNYDDEVSKWQPKD